MFLKKALILTATAALTVTALFGFNAASADETPFYVSGGIQRQWMKKADAKLDSINVRAGYHFLPNLAVEAEAAFGSGRDKTSGTPQYGLTDRIAAYVVASYPIGGNFDILARAGLADSKIKNEQQGQNVENGTSRNLGVGLQYHLADGFALRADYTHAEFLGHHGKAEATGLSLVKSF